MTDDNVANIVAKTGLAETEARKALEKLSPQNRMIEPEEVASLALLIASEKMAAMTGQAISVDGGAVMV